MADIVDDANDIAALWLSLELKAHRQLADAERQTQVVDNNNRVLCVDCDDAISAERLDLFPYCTVCAECQNYRELELSKSTNKGIKLGGLVDIKAQSKRVMHKHDKAMRT